MSSKGIVYEVRRKDGTRAWWGLLGAALLAGLFLGWLSGDSLRETLRIMTITITYKAGHTPPSETYTNCSGYTNDGKVVKFTGTIGEITAEWEINWDVIEKVQKVTDAT